VLSLSIGTEALTATDIATGESVTFDLVTTPDPRATLLEADLEPVVAVGDMLTLPALLVTNGWPVAGVPVTYRIVAGTGVLSTETAMTDANGVSEPVTLTLAGRGSTVVQIEAVGYSSTPAAVSMVAVVPPVAFAFPDPCPAECPAFDFSLNDWGTVLQIEVRDAAGLVSGFPVLVTPVGDPGWVGYSMGSYNVDLSKGGTVVTGENGVFGFWWSASHGGAHILTLSGPMIENAWTFRGAW
jgi:hypothetical protein